MAPSLQNGFTNWDDPEYVIENPGVRDLSASGLHSIATSFLEGNYHPMTMLSLAVDYRFGRLDPAAYHRTSLAIHVLATLAVFWFVLLLTGSRELSTFTALFFGVHPMHVESVAWVSGRKDVLYGLFYFLACAAYVVWLRRDRKGSFAYAATVLFFVLSVLSKAMAVTLPLALLAIDFVAGRRWSWKEQFAEKAPFFVLGLGFGVLAVIAQRAGGAVQEIARFPLHERVLIAAHALVGYVVRAVAPVHLSAFYPYPVKSGGSLPLEYYVAPLVVVALAALVVWSLRSSRTVAFGALFFLIHLLLVLQLLPVGSAAMADRYTYVPYVGIGLSLGAVVLAVTHRSAAARTLGYVLLAAFVLVLTVAARERVPIWRDGVTLWTDVLTRYPTLPTGYTHRAWALQEKGDVDRALADLDEALRLEPGNEEAHSTRGTIHLMRGDYVRARADLDEAVRLSPGSSAAWNNRGLVRMNQGDPVGAREDFTRAIELSPRSAEGYLNRAVALGAMGQYREAGSDIAQAIAILPDNARAHLLRGANHLALGDAAGAVADLDEALRLDPALAEAYFARSRANEALARFGEAVRDAERARDGGQPVPEEYLEKLRQSVAQP
jgi:tetratricopeptide (TPR) repeat protein